MELDGPILLAIIYGAVSLIAGILKKKGQAPSRRPERSSQTGVERRPPQTMDDLLAEMREELERASAPPEPQRDEYVLTAPPEEEFEEEFTSLEVEPEVVSMEVERVYEERAVRDYDAEAARLVQRRIDAADARNREWQPSDHRAFDARIRAVAPAAVPTPARRPNAAGLRDAIMWREILGPPLGWPDRDRR